MVQLKALEILLACFFLLYIFYIQCISNCIENSNTSHHFDHRSPSHHLLLTLAAFYFLSCGLSHNRRSESCETQLTSWHFPAQHSSSHSRKSNILTPTRACMTRTLSSLLPSHLPLALPHSNPTTPTSMLFLGHSQRAPASGPLHFWPLCL